VPSLGFRHSPYRASGVPSEGLDLLHHRSLQLLGGGDPWETPGHDQRDLAEEVNVLWEHSAARFLPQDVGGFLLRRWFAHPSALSPLCRVSVLVGDARS